MSRQWKPGDVAVATAPSGVKFRAVRTGRGTRAYWSAPEDWPSNVGRSEECDYRPLVVIDPEDIPVAKGSLTPTWLRNLASDLRQDSRTISTSLENVLTFLADEIERQTADPEPPEPQGLGAVVECEVDGKPGRGIFTGGGWVFRSDHLTDFSVQWGDFTAIRVLSEGVTK